MGGQAISAETGVVRAVTPTDFTSPRKGQKCSVLVSSSYKYSNMQDKDTDFLHLHFLHPSWSQVCRINIQTLPLGLGLLILNRAGIGMLEKKASEMEVAPPFMSFKTINVFSIIKLTHKDP